MAHAGGGAEQWHYIDRHSKEYGPFDTATMLSWFRQGLFHPIGTELLVRLREWTSHVPVRELYPADAIFVGPPRVAGRPPAAAPQGPPPRGRSRSRGAARPPPSMAAVPAHGPPPAPSSAPAPAHAPPPQAHGPPPACGAPPPHWPPPAQHGPPPHGYPPPYYPYAPPPYGYAAPPPGPYYAPPPYGPPPRGGRHHGRVKSFNERHGYGFIENIELHREHGRDVFVHKSELGDCQVGDEVTFFCELNKDGKPQARDLRSHDGRSATARAAPPRMLPPDAYVPPGADAKKGVRRKAKAKAKGKPGRTQTRSMLKAMAEQTLPPRTKEQTAVRLNKSLDELIQEDRGPPRGPQAAAGAQPAAAAAKPAASGKAALDMPLDALVAK